jgi:thioredoxin 1
MNTLAKMGIVVGLVAAVAVVIVLKRSDATPPADAAPPAAGLPRLVDLGSTTCIPCKMMAPILEGIKQEFAGRLQVDFIDVNQNAEAARQYGIKLIPTQIFFDASGAERFRHEGFFSREDILAKWKELGVDLSPAAPAPAGPGAK